MACAARGKAGTVCSLARWVPESEGQAVEKAMRGAKP